MKVLLNKIIEKYCDVVEVAYTAHSLTLRARVVRRMDNELNAIHRINHYPVDSMIGFVLNTYPLDSDLSCA